MEQVKSGVDISAEGEKLNDVEKTLNRFGIALRDSQLEFRSMEDVLDDVAAKWEYLGSVEQAQIATALAGKMCAGTYGDIWGYYVA